MANQKHEAFLAVARTGSFKQAAGALGYTQAGISYLVNSLERELGLPLFVREYGGARLTAEGADIMPWVQKACNAERQLEAHVAGLKQLESGTVRVAAFTSTAIQWFPGIAKEFMAAHPAVDLQLACIDNEDEMEEAVWNGDVDCGFLVYPIARSLDAVFLHRDPLLVILPPDHALARQGAAFVPKRTLAEEPYIRLESGSLSEMEAVFRRNGVVPAVRFATDNDYAVMSMVSAGLGFSVLSGLLLPKAPFPLAVLPPETETHREIAIAVRSMDAASTAAKAFVRTAQEWVARRYGDAPAPPREG